MTGMWPVIGLAGIMLLGFASLVIAGVAVVHVGYRWWLMIMCGIDWDDAGALIRAKYRKRHGAHRVGVETASWPQAGAFPREDEQPALQQPAPQHPSVAQRLSEVTQLTPLPVRPAVTGRPPWEDQTQVVPVMGSEQVWLRPGEKLADPAATETFARPVSLGEQLHDPARCDRGGQPHLGPCNEWLRPGGGLDQTVQMPVPHDRRG